ncbi:unnamed protein product [Somion occarium]|uniref:Uncharacterized protein n=1 Tax=Somion occarium TaxID=3059160 RepID=A0ABP1E7M0_9APHY
MTSDFALKAGRKLFERNLEQYQPVDPLYETYTDKKGKERRRKRELPPGLSARDAKILKSVKRRAHYLDKGFRICGLRFGWTFIIGMIPGAGDAADAALNYFLVVRKARKAELPSWLVRKMLFNNAVSLAVGLVPLAGDIILAVFKANSRNAALLEEFLRVRGEEFLKQESERMENPQNVKPGAGTEPGEHIPRKDEKGGWFKFKRSKGKGKEVSSKKMTPSPTGSPPEEGRRSESRFVEDVPSSRSSPKKR